MRRISRLVSGATFGALIVGAGLTLVPQSAWADPVNPVCQELPNYICCCEGSACTCVPK